jgi:uncharacterized protein
VTPEASGEPAGTSSGASSGASAGRSADDTPDASDAEVVALATALRAAGVRVGTDQVVTHRRALAVVDRADREDRYWAGRVTLVTDPRDLPRYDAVFAALEAGDAEVAVGPTGDPSDTAPPEDAPRLQDRPAAGAPGTSPTTTTAVTFGAGGDDPDPDQPREPDDAPPTGAVASVRERLRHRRFDRATDDELAAIAAELRRLEVAIPQRRSRRTTSGRRGTQIDLTRTLERATDAGGEIVDLDLLSRRSVPRRLVVLLDVSGSMAGYARALLRFALVARRTAAGRPDRKVEVFAFGTRLTRLTDALDERDPDAALRAAAARVVDWDGGTRIAACLEDLVRTQAPQGRLRGAVVVVCSDGLERGDPERLGLAVARLRRHVHRLVWVNPLAGDPRYTPTQRGMAAALPHLDVFLPGHDLASLEQLSATLADLR